MRPWFIALAVIGVLNAAVAAYYYLRIISLMYFREPLATLRAEGGPGAYVAALLCSLAVLVLGFFPGPLMKGCVEAGKSREQGAGSGGQEAGWHASGTMYAWSWSTGRHVGGGEQSADREPAQEF